MGRHVEAAGASRGLRRTALVCGLLGGVAWVAAYPLDPDAGVARVLVWGGGILLTVALLGIGMMLVKSDLLAFRVFVGLALPTLVWGVFALLRGAVGEAQLSDALFGAVVGIGSVLLLGRRPAGPSALRTTL